MDQLTVSDIAAIERATVDAVAPAMVEERPDLPGWLLPVDTGTVNRARSAVPLWHAAGDGLASGDGTPGPVAAVAAIEAHYAASGQPAILRLPDVSGFDAYRRALADRGYAAGEPVLVQVAETATMRGMSPHPAAEVDAQPDAAWAALFLGPGFDSADGASRVAALSRATGSVFASLRVDGQTLAAGAGAFSHGWASVHGMRTAASHRGQGLAGRVLAALAAAADQRGLARVFLQVEERNASALALYRRAGFRTAWSYRYWQRP